MTDIFISYKRRLRPRVEEIAAALRALGLTVWFDAALEAGTSFSAEISNEVRSAGCILVCWSDDAFPHGGDTTGWVVGEATIGQGRSRLVPVLLEPTELDPPWNTLHTESLIDWTPGTPGHPGWRNTLSAIGRHLGRPDLADAAAVLAAGETPVSPPRSVMPGLPMVAVAGFAGAAVTAIGAAIFAGVDPGLRSGYFALLPGVALYAVPFAALFYRALGPLKALALIIAFVAAFGIGAMAGILSLAPTPFRADPATYDIAEMMVCAIAGFLGAGISLAAFPILGLVQRSRAVWLRIAMASLALAVIATAIAAMPFFNLEISNSAILWLAAIWQLAYAPALVWVLRSGQARSASTM